MIYYTHDNGGRPFRVELSNNKKTLHTPVIDTNNLLNVFDNYPHSKTYNKKIYSTKYTNIWIGKSPKIESTIFSGGYGKKFEGNSILIETGNLEYVFIGEKIFTFKSISPIKKYISPVGNNDVPYPYAVDLNGYIYLMIENVIILPNQKTKELFDKSDEPYSVYYQIQNINPTKFNLSKDEFNYDISSLVIGDQNKISEKHLGTKKNGKSSITKKSLTKKAELTNIREKSFTFNYYTNPEEEYERLRRLNKKSGEHLHIETSDHKLIQLSKKDYVNIIHKWGQLFGLQKFIGNNVIVNRQ